MPEKMLGAGEELGLCVEGGRELAGDPTGIAARGSEMDGVAVLEDAADLDVGEGEDSLAAGVFGGALDGSIEGLASKGDDGAAGGLRQTASGTALATSPLPAYKDAETRRVAKLTLDASGNESGIVDIAFFGAPALRWRQTALLGDDISLHHDLEAYLLALIPKGSEATLQSLENLTDGEKPLILHFQVAGPLAHFTGKSSLAPAQFFQVNDTARFPSPDRTLPIEFDYPESVHDAIQLKFPPSLQLDTAPSPETDTIPKLMACDFRVDPSPTSIVLRRDFIFGGLALDPTHYTELRTFYEKVETRDHALILFKTSPLTPHPNP